MLHFRLRSKALLAMCVCLGLCLPLLSPTSVHAGVYHEVQNLAGGKCLWSPNATVGTTVEQYTCVTGWAPEEWNFISVADPVDIIQNRNSGLCVDEYHDGQSNGTQDIQYPCNSGDYAQDFTIGAYGNKGCPSSETALQIVNSFGRYLLLDDYRASTSNYAPTDFWARNGSSAQTWCLRY
jgi:Ricin-type beta-trefoil lectin domain